MTPSPVALTIGLLIAVLADAPPAGAQSSLRPYAGGSVGNFSVSADEAEGRSASGGFFAGVALAKYVDVEFDVVVPASSFTRTYTGTSVSFAPPGASRAEIDRLSVITRFDKEREVSASISAVVIIHPAAGQRITPGLIVGLTNQRARDRTVYTPISIPEGIDPAASGGRRPHRVVCAQHRRPDHRRPTRDRRHASAVHRPGRALRLRLDRR